jgi:hypothetical protein
MSDFLGYLQRLKVRPNPDDLTPTEQKYLNAHFDPHAAEVEIDGQIIDWNQIDEIEVVQAARMSGAAGWLVRQIYGEDRYHVGLYYAHIEAVLPNVSFNTARFVVQTIAFYAPQPIRYKGVEGLAPIANA